MSDNQKPLRLDLNLDKETEQLFKDADCIVVGNKEFISKERSLHLLIEQQANEQLEPQATDLCQIVSFSVLPDGLTKKGIKAIRNYFGENDKSMFEHMAYDALNMLLKHIDAVSTES